MDLITYIQNKASELLPEVIKIRRDLHMHPELSFQEEQTSRYITEVLSRAGIEYATGYGGHGIVATIKGKTDKVIALRADMDALPIEEQNDVSYKSQNPGVMHACGHDVHTACLLGAALILNNIKDALPCSVRLIFQPGEEKLPGGASLMIRDGVLQDPTPEGIIGQHVYPPLEAGKVGIRSGLYMASSDEIYITVSGNGGHGAMPHLCTDSILAASQMIVAMQQLVARNIPPTIPAVLTFGKINSIGGATNVIPSEVKIEGTFRTMNEEWREKAHRLIEKIAKETTSAYGAIAEVNIVKGYPSLINDEKLTSKTRQMMETYLGKENVIDLDMRMTSEDFAYYSQEIPAVFYRLGTGNKARGITSPVHTPTFDIDEIALETGMGLLAWLAVQA